MGKEKTRRKWSMRIIIVTSLFLCFFAAFASVVYTYIQKFDQSMARENKIHLSEISSHIALHMTTVVHDTQEALKGAASAVAALDTESARMDYLQKLAAQYSFAYMGYAGPDGTLHATIPSESVNIGEEAYFLAATEGQSIVTDLTQKIFKDRAITGIILAVPLESDRGNGALVAMIDIAKLGSALQIESFDGNGYSYIVDKDGNLVLRTKSLDFNNLFKAWQNVQFSEGHSLDQFLADVRAGQENLTLFSSMGVEKYAYYRPLGLNSWTVVNIVSKDTVSAQVVLLTKELASIGATMIISFLLLVIFSIISYNISQNRKQAADAKSAFLANMSHEIRTPMNAIVGLGEILLRNNLPKKQQEIVLSIVNSGKGLLTIINDILDISKIEAGKYTIVSEPYELESLLYDVTTVAAIRIGEKPVEFLIDPDPNLPRHLIGDMSRIKQLLLNIVGNAVKFTARGSIHLTLSGVPSEGSLVLCIEVKDTGIGIKPEDMESLFVTFNQVDTRRNRNIEGTGLGLAISKRLCEMMGGKICLQSEYGKGSVFTMTVQQNVTDLTPLIEKVAGDIKILICEPSTILRAYEASCMNKLGVHYAFCETKEEFVAILDKSDYTHALASHDVLRGINEEDFANTRIVRLLSLQEHTLMNSGNANIYLPLFASHLSSILRNAPETPSTIKSPYVDTGMIKPMPHVRILIVDDNELNLEVAMGLLSPYNMQMDCAYSGQEAIDAVQNKTYDLVFMDHMMPGMDGVEATKLIRAICKDLPIVVLTANATQEARQLFAKEGFDGFLAKPIETTKMNEVLRKWLKNLNEERAMEEANVMIKKRFSTIPDSILKLTATEIDFRRGLETLGSISAYTEILQTYNKTAEGKLPLLPCIAEKDREKFISEIRDFKSTSTAIAAFNLADLAEELEQQSTQGNFIKVRELLPQFIKKGTTVLNEISVFLDHLNETCKESAAADEMPSHKE